MGTIYVKDMGGTSVAYGIGVEAAADVLREAELEALSQGAYDSLDFTLIIHGKKKTDGE